MSKCFKNLNFDIDIFNFELFDFKHFSGVHSSSTHILMIANQICPIVLTIIQI